jgi:hypothetical protein
MHFATTSVRRHGSAVVLAAILGTGLAAVAPSPAQAAEPLTAGPAAGPIDPNTGYPFWYADDTGERFEFCLDRPDTPPGLCLAAPENAGARPWTDEDPARSNLAADPETFWYSADANIEQGGVNAHFVSAQEAAFGGAGATAGEQATFGRVRVRLRGVRPGASYTVTQPYGTDTYVADDRGQVFVTEDIGCFDAPCDFTKPYDSSVTSYLRWDPSVGAEAPEGYTGDPNVPHQVVGSPTQTNFFRVEGPAVGGRGVNVVETDLFNVQGKLWNPSQPMLGLVSTHNDVDFGKVMLGATDPLPAQTVTLTNAGGGAEALQLGTLGVSGAQAPRFSLTNDTCTGAALAPDETCTVSVSYTPAATAGTARAQLDVPSTNGTDSVGGQRILLRGRVSDGTGKDARVTGPISPDHGYPAWYQDENGTRVAICDDQADPLCGLPDVADGTYDPALPISFPDNFPEELFWWSADATFDTTNTVTRGDVSARLVLAEEATFASGEPAPGDQIAFGRIRIRVDGLVLGGSYHVVTPYGDYDFVAEDDGTGRGEINYTEDLGCLETPCNFDRVNQSNVGPFLRQVGAPDGYLGDPGVEAPLTGGQKFVVSGPGLTKAETNLFGVLGKELAAGPAEGRVTLSTNSVRVTPGQTGSVTVTNSGTVPASPQFSLPVNSGFAIVDNGCAGVLAPGGFCTVTIGLAGGAPGASATLTVLDGTTPVGTVTLQRPGGGNPAPTGAGLATVSDTGLFARDNLTSVGAVTVAGAAATGQAVDVFVDGALATTTTAQAGTFTAPLVLDEGVHEVSTAYAGQPASATATVRVDTTAPDVTAPQIRTGLSTGKLAGAVTWSGPGAATFQAQVSRGGDAFTAVSLPRAGATRTEYSMRSGVGYRFRVRGVDAAGNAGPWATTRVRPLLLQERAHQVRYDGGWARPRVTASGDRVRSSANRGATATVRSRARTVQVVAPTGPDRGRAAILVNGHRLRVVDLYSARYQARQTVATVQGLAPQKTSVVKVRVLDRKRHASKGTRVALDAFVVVR